MEMAVPALVALLVGCIALAFYMNWLGLFVSEEEMRAERARSKESMRELRQRPGDKAPEADAIDGQRAGDRASDRAVAFDVDAASLGSIREALPAWKIEVVNGATPASLPRDWGPGAAGLLVVGLRANVSESLGLCRFLAFCNSSAGDFRTQTAGPSELPGNGQDRTRRDGALLLVLMPPGQEPLLEEALDAGTHRCLPLPIQARDVARLLTHPHAADPHGRRSGGPNEARREDLWRDDGGQG